MYTGAQQTNNGFSHYDSYKDSQELNLKNLSLHASDNMLHGT